MGNFGNFGGNNEIDGVVACYYVLRWCPMFLETIIVFRRYENE